MLVHRPGPALRRGFRDRLRARYPGGGSLKVENPNDEFAACGCGSSFRVARTRKKSQPSGSHPRPRRRLAAVAASERTDIRHAKA